MSWHHADGVILDSKGNVVCTFLPNTDPFIVDIIENGDYAIDLMREFIEYYDARRKILKGLYNKFCDIINMEQNYTLEWKFNDKGDLEDLQGNSICLFASKGTENSKIIKFLPVVYSTIKECIANFNSSSTAKQKYTYEKFCRVYEKIGREQ